MFYGDTVEETRRIFFGCWEKFKKKQPLAPFEHQVVEVLEAHPEYHQFLENPEKYLDYVFRPEVDSSNPFLHLGLHLAIREQIATNRPLGIEQVYQQLLKKHAAPLEVEHLIMNELAELIWQAQKYNLPLEDQDYLQALRALT